MSEYPSSPARPSKRRCAGARRLRCDRLDELDFEILTPGSRGVLGMGAGARADHRRAATALGGAAPPERLRPPPPPAATATRERRSDRPPRPRRDDRPRQWRS